MKSLKYLMETIVRTRSLMFETLAFSKGEIFMLIVLAVYSEEKASRIANIRQKIKSGWIGSEKYFQMPSYSFSQKIKKM